MNLFDLFENDDSGDMKEGIFDRFKKTSAASSPPQEVALTSPDSKVPYKGYPNFAAYEKARFDKMNTPQDNSRKVGDLIQYNLQDYRNAHSGYNTFANSRELKGQNTLIGKIVGLVSPATHRQSASYNVEVTGGTGKYTVELPADRYMFSYKNSDHELDEKSSLKLGAKLGSRLVNRRQAHALTTKFRKPKLNFEEDDEVQTVFNAGDRVMYMRNLATVIKCDGNTCGIKIDRHPGTIIVPTHMVKKPSYDESIEEQNLDEILAPSQLAKLQSIRAQLPKAGGQTPSIPSDTDRADAEAWLSKLKNKNPVADKKSGEDPLNFDRPGRPRQASYHEIQGKIEKLKSIKDLLKSIDKTEPRAMRSANKFGGADEISNKAQMMHDVVDNLNLNYTNEQELESIERRLSEYLQQLVAKSAAWKKPSKPSKHGAVTIIKPGEGGEISEGTDDDYPDYEDDEVDPDAGGMGTPEFRKGLERLKQLANYGKPKDSPEKEETKKKVNEDNSAAVTAHGYRYNQQDQRVSWTKDFASEAQAKEWARRCNATVLSIIPKQGVVETEENNDDHEYHLYYNGSHPNKGMRVNKTVYKNLKSVRRAADRLDNEYGAYAHSHKKVKKSQPENIKEGKPVFEEENRFTLYLNGKPQTHHATPEEARRFSETVKLKYPDVKIEIKQEMREESDIEEGWKSKLAGAALAGAAAFGGGGANAADVNDPSWNKSGYDSHVKADNSVTTSTSSSAGSAPQVSKDSQRRISDVTGPNAQGEYRVSVSQNGKLVSQFVTKTPPQGWMVKEGDMDAASHNPSGAKFGGYYKGTQKGAPRAGQGFGSMEEGILGNLKVRSEEVTDLKKHEDIKMKKPDAFKGNPNRNNLVAAQARNLVAKGAQTAGPGTGSHKNKALDAKKGLTRNLKHKTKFDFSESPNFLTWARDSGYNVIGNPAVYEDAKRIYSGLIAESKKKLSEDKKELKPGQYYIWTVYFDDGTSKRIKVKDEKFDVTKYYAEKNEVVVNVDYNWEPHNG